MKIQNVYLKNFKRFTDLSIKNIPPTAKLVVVVGPNGSGKSSLFDAMMHWYRLKVGFGAQGDHSYFRKDVNDSFDWDNTVKIDTINHVNPRRGSLYIRSAYRNDPDFNVGSLKRLPSPTEQIRLGRIIDNDQTVSENYQRLVYDTTAAMYDPANDSRTVLSLRNELIGRLQNSMRAVFGDLILENVSDPLGNGAFFFSKGQALRYHYKNLSGGEKSAFDLLLDLHIKKKFHGDAVYCIDELETHLHTRVQGLLLKEIFSIIPEGGQLWITTHSLGVLRAAQEIEVLNPGSVCLIDFDVTDPDAPKEILPSSLDRTTWEKMLSIAIDDLTPRIAPSVIIVCEGSSIGNRRKDFDAEIYNRILGSLRHGVVFVSGGGTNQLSGSGISIRETLRVLLPNTKVVALYDRDDKSALEVRNLEAQGDIVLGRRNIESYLLDDEVISALAHSSGKQSDLPAAVGAKAQALADSIARGNSVDDLKSAAGQIYVSLKQIFALTRCGNNTDAFLRDTMAPLLNDNMSVHEELRKDVMSRI